MINSIGSGVDPLYSMQPSVRESEAAEKTPDNEAAESFRAKAPLGQGQGSVIDVEA